eukprot:1033700-Prymnesium_polylepis.2
MSERATRRLRGCAHNPEGCLCFEAARRLRREVRVVLGDLDAWQDLHILGEPYAVGALEHVVELTVEVGRKLVEQAVKRRCEEAHAHTVCRAGRGSSPP